MPEISIIVPVYNVEMYVEKCVCSILEQTYPDFELILVDDGSTDRSGELCEELARRDARIRVIHKTNAGPGALIWGLLTAMIRLPRICMKPCTKIW